MLFLYPLDPLNRHHPDEVYATEAAAADRMGIPWTLIDHDALMLGDVDRAVRRVPVQSCPGTGVYRGWMMTVDQYGLFYQTLQTRGVQLINSPDAYRHCHHLPESYPVIEGNTPLSVWLSSRDEIDMDEIMALVRPFGDAPLVVKDYAKSQKHVWEEACFIPSASDGKAVERVVRRFLDLQDQDLAGGLVFRKYVEFEPVGRHKKSQMPLTLEYRLFFLNGRLLLCAEYWEEGDYRGEVPPTDQFTALAARVGSRFFTMDVAKRQGGDWLVVELGDGQVAGMPDKANVNGFYSGLANDLGRAR